MTDKKTLDFGKINLDEVIEDINKTAQDEIAQVRCAARKSIERVACAAKSAIREIQSQNEN